MIVIETKKQFRSGGDFTIPGFNCVKVRFIPFLVITSWKKKTSGVYPK